MQKNTSAAATNAIILNETMEALIPTIKDKLSQGQKYEKAAYKKIAKSLIFYRDCGDSLSKLKKEFHQEGLKKQKFYEYVEEKLGIKERMNQRYMQLGESKRLKGVSDSYFAKMNKPSLIKVIQALALNDEDWERVINGDDTPLKPKKLTDSEKDDMLQKEYKNQSYKNISFEEYKKYISSSKESLIAMIDDTITQTKNSEITTISLATNPLNEIFFEEKVEVEDE